MPQVRRRSGDMGSPQPVSFPNAVTKRVDGNTQVKPLKNAVSKAGYVGPTKIGNAVNGPKSPL